MSYRCFLPLVLCGVVIAVTAAAVEEPAPSTKVPQSPRPRVLAPTWATPPAAFSRFSTDMPIDMVRIVPESQVLPGGELPPMPATDVNVDAPNARLRTYVTSMPIVAHGHAPAPVRPTPPRSEPLRPAPPGETPSSPK